MDDDPLVSVVVPSYNDGENLYMCVESILSQSFKEYELIVVDDASKDESGIKIRELEDQRVRYVRNEINQGPAASRNKGVSLSKASIIAFTDSDCVVSGDWLMNAVDILNNRGEVSGVGGPILNLGKGLVSETRHLLEFREFTDDKEKKVRLLPTANAVYRREKLVEAGLFNEKLKYAEDLDVAWKMIKRGYEIIYSPQVMVSHRTPNHLGSFLRKQVFTGRWFYIIRRVHPKLPIWIPSNDIILLLLSPILYLLASLRSLYLLPDKKVLMRSPGVIPLAFVGRLFFFIGVTAESITHEGLRSVFERK